MNCIKKEFIMISLGIDFSTSVGRVKPMHATNNGPVVKQEDVLNGTLHPFNNNLEEFKAAGIPYARTHDTSFYHRYGLEHVIDVYYIFPNFDADPDDPENYDFACTDHYIAGCEMAGVEVFYRLGHRIEHEVKKYGVHPPKDFKKWAKICEHIIRHYTEGWANGFKYKMTYWEIWGEPDLDKHNPAKSPCWTGTKEQFFAFFNTVASHLKSCFPHLKIGGPAIAHDLEWTDEFLSNLTAPLDFFSWHKYAHLIETVLDMAEKVRKLLDKHGYTETESIMDEWNYVLGWSGDDIVYSHDQRGRIKGASFSVAMMCSCQYAPVDMIMYYDARPNEFWNGMFDDTVVGRVLKGYYPFPMFNTLYRLGDSVKVSGMQDGIWAAAAKGGEEGAILLTHFNDDDRTEAKTVSLELSGFGTEGGTEVEYFILDAERDLVSLGRNTYFGDRFGIELTMPNFTSYLIKLRAK